MTWVFLFWMIKMRRLEMDNKKICLVNLLILSWLRLSNALEMSNYRRGNWIHKLYRLIDGYICSLSRIYAIFSYFWSRGNLTCCFNGGMSVRRWRWPIIGRPGGDGGFSDCECDCELLRHFRRLKIKKKMEKSNSGERKRDCRVSDNIFCGKEGRERGLYIIEKSRRELHSSQKNHSEVMQSWDQDNPHKELGQYVWQKVCFSLRLMCFHIIWWFSYLSNG